MELALPQHPSMGLVLSPAPQYGAGSPPGLPLLPSQAGSTAHLHLEDDVVPAGLVELVGVEEECEDVVGIGTVFRQSLGILFGVAGRQLGWGMLGDEEKLFTNNFCAETKP